MCPRTVADAPFDGRRVVVNVRVRRLVCPVLGCRRQTFREQVPGLIERLQRRTTRLTSQVSWVVKELCGRAPPGYRPCPSHSPPPCGCCGESSHAAVRIPRAIGVDDFALRRRHRCAMIIIEAETGERIGTSP